MKLTSIDTVLNVFESVDVIALIKGGSYDDLNLTVGDALLKRSAVSIPFSISSTRQLTVYRTSPASSHVQCKTVCQQSTTQYANHECTASSSLMMTRNSEAC